MLEIQNLAAAYGMVQILSDVSFKVESKEIVSIIGPNGAGKTTLVKTIMGFMHPKDGTIQFKGEHIEKLPAYEIVKKGLTMIPEGREVFPRMTVEENLLLGAYTINDKAKVKDSLGEGFPDFPSSKEEGKSVSSNSERRRAADACYRPKPDV